LRKKPTPPRRPKTKLARWQIIKLKSTPAQLLAIVDAPDEVTALKEAAERLDLRTSDLPRLIVRRAST
jgi:hypothetical protein